MAGIQGSNQSPIITQRYLNTAAYAGDPAPGVLVASSQVSGSIVQSYAGQLGGVLTMGEGLANYYTDPASAQLYSGDYLYVQFLSSSTATAAQGCIVFWSNVLNGNFIVTPDASATNDSLIAGVALCATGKGNYWWIQRAGIAQVLFKTSVTKATPAVGDMVYVDAAPSNKADVIADATALTSPQLKLSLGRAWGAAPASTVISPVALGLGCLFNTL